MAANGLESDGHSNPSPHGSSVAGGPVNAQPLSKSEVEYNQHWEIELDQAKRAIRLSTHEGLLPRFGTDLFGAPGRLLSKAATQPDLLTQSLNLVYISADQKVRLAHASAVYPTLRRKWAQDNMHNSSATDQEVRAFITQRLWQEDQNAKQQEVVDDVAHGDGQTRLANPSLPPLETNGELNLSNDWEGGDPAGGRNTNLTDWQAVTTRTYDAPVESPEKTVNLTGVVHNAKGPQYSQATMRKLQDLRPYVEEHSRIWGVDPFEVMLSIAEEHGTRKGLKGGIDRAQDAFARDGYHSDIVLKGIDGKPDRHIGADIGSGNFAAHNAAFLLQHYARDSRVWHRETAPSLPGGSVAKWLTTDRGISYAAAMHFRFYHDRYDPLISAKLSQEERLRMGVMFFRQGDNFDYRYATQRMDLGGPEVTRAYVEKNMLEKHEIPPSLLGKTTPNIPQSGHDSFVDGYENKILQLRWLFGKSE